MKMTILRRSAASAFETRPIAIRMEQRIRIPPLNNQRRLALDSTGSEQLLRWPSLRQGTNRFHDRAAGGVVRGGDVAGEFGADAVLVRLAGELDAVAHRVQHDLRFGELDAQEKLGLHRNLAIEIERQPALRA